MKIVLLVCSLFLSSNSAQQYYYTFTELKGMEDQSGNTHLFYRLYTFTKGDLIWGDYYQNSLYHFDLVGDVDTLFIYDGGIINSEWGDYCFYIDDYNFWENNFNKYVYAGTQFATEPVPVVYRYNETEPIFLREIWGIGKNLELSRQDTNIVFFSTDYLNFKSTDWGNTWDTLSYGYEILSVSPFDHNIIYSTDGAALLKSINGGSTFYIVDTSRIYSINFLYDPDSTHIYALDTRYGNHLVVSNNKGEAFSWTEKYSSSNPIYISLNYSQSGSIYLADGRYIYHSTDYGLTFNEYKVLDRKIVGIYKKPNSDKLYATTKYDLYEITPDTIINLKHLPTNPQIFEWFPLSIGDKWYYNYIFHGDFDPQGTSYQSVWEVIGYKQINDKYYAEIFINNWEILDPFIPETNKIYFRTDSLTGRIYIGYLENESLIESFYLDLTMEPGDTIYLLNNEDDRLFCSSLYPLNIFNFQTELKKYSTYFIQLDLIKGLGLRHYFGGALVWSERILKGAIIDGVVYGDTTLVGIDDENENLPTEFSLSQNYPNPFNPSTTLSFAISHSSMVTLKVYDILGREVATLVNEEKPAGEYEIMFSVEGGSASGGNASSLSSGIYFYQLKAGEYIQTKKMILTK